MASAPQIPYPGVMKTMVVVGFVAMATMVAGCLDQDRGPGVVGSIDDVTTTSGTFVGYRVNTACPQPYATFGVIGTGSLVLTTIHDVSAAGAVLHDELADVTSIWGWGGFALGCEPGAATTLSLSSWRDIDAVIVRTGEWLRSHDLALQVAIDVGSPPVPSAN
jgi:hypothetical protein